MDSNFKVFIAFATSANNPVNINELLYSDKKTDIPNRNNKIIKNELYAIRYKLHSIFST
jgi:hypothetical protein